MGKSTVLKSYRSTTGKILYLTPVFTYYIEVFIIYKKRVELLYSSYKYSLTPINLLNNSVYKKYRKYTICTSIEWYGAPKNYLEKNGYIPIDLEQYKVELKEKRKHGKVRNR